MPRKRSRRRTADETCRQCMSRASFPTSHDDCSSRRKCRGHEIGWIACWNFDSARTWVERKETIWTCAGWPKWCCSRSSKWRRANSSTRYWWPPHNQRDECRPPEDRPVWGERSRRGENEQKSGTMSHSTWEHFAADFKVVLATISSCDWLDRDSKRLSTNISYRQEFNESESELHTNPWPCIERTADRTYHDDNDTHAFTKGNECSKLFDCNNLVHKQKKHFLLKEESVKVYRQKSSSTDRMTDGPTDTKNNLFCIIESKTIATRLTILGFMLTFSFCPSLFLPRQWQQEAELAEKAYEFDGRKIVIRISFLLKHACNSLANKLSGHLPTWQCQPFAPLMLPFTTRLIKKECPLTLYTSTSGVHLSLLYARKDHKRRHSRRIERLSMESKRESECGKSAF